MSQAENIIVNGNEAVSLYSISVPLIGFCKALKAASLCAANDKCLGEGDAITRVRVRFDGNQFTYVEALNGYVAYRRRLDTERCLTSPLTPHTFGLPQLYNEPFGSILIPLAEAGDIVKSFASKVEGQLSIKVETERTQTRITLESNRHNSVYSWNASPCGAFPDLTRLTNTIDYAEENIVFSENTELALVINTQLFPLLGKVFDKGASVQFRVNRNIMAFYDDENQTTVYATVMNNSARRRHA